MRKIRFLFGVLILFSISGHSLASAEDDFRKGVSHFKQQQYQQAINAFNKARKQGMKTAALFNNIAISYFRLGKYDKANEYFKYLRRYPKDRMQAEYNLGLVAKKQNKQATAKAQFTLVKNQAKNKKLVTLARIQLGELKLEKQKKSWSAFGKVGFGNDDNITAVPEATPTKRSSSFKDIYVGGDLLIYGRAKSGLLLNAFASRFDYSDFAQYDQSILSLGAKATFLTGKWANAIKLDSEKISYGHANYQRVLKFEANTKRYLTANGSLRLRFKYDDISSLNSTYNYLEGTRQRLRAEYRLYGKTDYAKFYFEHETNDRNNTPTANYSPTRDTLRAYYEYSFTDAISLGADISYRDSTYPAKATTLEREDKRERYALNLTYAINKNWKVRGKLQHTDNDSTNAIYTYQRDVSSLSLIAIF